MKQLHVVGVEVVAGNRSRVVLSDGSELAGVGGIEAAVEVNGIPHVRVHCQIVQASGEPALEPDTEAENAEG